MIQSGDRSIRLFRIHLGNYILHSLISTFNVIPIKIVVSYFYRY